MDWPYYYSDLTSSVYLGVSVTDKGYRVYPLDLHPDAVVYPGCTLSKHLVWVLPDDRHIASLVELRVRWKELHNEVFFAPVDPNQICPGKGLVLPYISIDAIATNSHFLIVSITNQEISWKSLFAIQKSFKGIAGDPKSVLKSDDPKIY
ncbi:hypothetical protein TNCV_4371601 [Trichonephila clavipes]|nr:hypothetical protein TNCV_4371601 [Trichonephila clavipes]